MGRGRDELKKFQDKQSLLFDFDRRLMSSATKNVEKLLEERKRSGILDHSPLPIIERLKSTPSEHYMQGESWSPPARFCWLAVIEDKPNFSTLSKLSEMYPNSWSWLGGDIDFEPSLWGASALARDERQIQTLLPQILSQALADAPNPDTRAQRVGLILGAGLTNSMSLLSHWHAAGWKSTRTFAPPLSSLLRAVIDPQKEAQRDGLWKRWIQAMSQVATSPAELAQWKEQVLAQALAAWKPVVRFGSKPKRTNSVYALQQSNLDQDIVSDLRSLTHWKSQGTSYNWGDTVRESAASLLVEVLASEATRGPLTVQDLNPIIAGVCLHALADQPLPGPVIKAVWSFPFEHRATSQLQNGNELLSILKRRSLSDTLPQLNDSVPRPTPKM